MKDISFEDAFEMMWKPLEETDRLRRCPLCDSHAEMRLLAIEGVIKPHLTYGVICTRCGLTLKGELREFLVRRWNERPVVSVTQL